MVDRRPSSRAIVSVPIMSVGSSPASRTAMRIARADGKETCGSDELRVELAHRHDARRVERRGVLLPERDERVVKLVARQRSSGRNDATSGPITPASTTDATCGGPVLRLRRGRGEVLPRAGSERRRRQDQREGVGRDIPVDSVYASSVVSDAGRP